MGRTDPKKKVVVSPAVRPLQSDAFAVLGQLDALKNLPAPVEVKPVKKESVAPEGPVKSLGRLVLRREKKDRGGKTVVVISGFEELPNQNAVLIANLARDLKNKLGCGGSFDRREIVLQGDRCPAVCAALEQMGYRVDGVRE